MRPRRGASSKQNAVARPLRLESDEAEGSWRSPLDGINDVLNTPETGAATLDGPRKLPFANPLVERAPRDRNKSEYGREPEESGPKGIFGFHMWEPFICRSPVNNSVQSAIPLTSL